MNSDLYTLIGGTPGDALQAVDHLLRGINPYTVDPDSLHTLLLTVRSLIARIDQERKRTK